MNTIKNKILALVAVILCLSSCDKYLDTQPDNRAELDSDTKIKKLLVSAYPGTPYLMSSEFSSDNLDDYGNLNPNSTRLLTQLFNWEDVSEIDNESPDKVWESCYAAIASANEALAAFEETGSKEQFLRGEALVARAYSHFILVNMFSQHYSITNGSSDLGITYMMAPERTLNPDYKRNSVKEVYEYIVKDLEEGIPLIDDAKYDVPKYHFNKAAANAFAARVHLYMGNWEKAISYATASIGIDPTPLLRNNAQIRAAGAAAGGEVINYSRAYTQSSEKSNLLMGNGDSNMGLYFGPYYLGSRYSHGGYVCRSETFLSTTPWGSTTAQNYALPLLVYSGTNLDKNLVGRVTYEFQYTDPVAQIGYRKAVYVPFTSDETLLIRAEAKIMLKQYDEALVDMNMWRRNFVLNPTATFNANTINTWANGLAYHTPLAPTAKKKLNPDFSIETGTQENFIHAVLFMRRLETMHAGLRWFDVKRYGIEIQRRVIQSGNPTLSNTPLLKVRDNRRAIQLPISVIGAGAVPNPR